MDDVSDPKFWDAAYDEKRDGWELGDVAPPISRALREMRGTGRAVVFGCGRGHEVRAAARAGLDVVGIDFAAQPIADAERMTPPALAHRIAWRRADIFALDDEGAFDLLIEHTSYCAIDPKRRDEWMRVGRKVLKPGGTLLGLFYAHERPGGPPYATTREEARVALERNGFRIERSETPADSIERRRDNELLVIAKSVPISGGEAA
ncbi:MAG TPA: methyltransferase domain-containing protein [Polyangiaceae bacterium]|jgi:SAM-dependent methyltransferase|nr:methyltransferase domain-containing protein [Polyangiaceae bacterium]